MPLNLKTVIPGDWVQDNENQEVNCTLLDRNNKNYKIIERHMSNIARCSISSIERIENSFLWGCYLMKKKEYSQLRIGFEEKVLLHCTGANKIPSIIKNNLDWRKFVRVRFGQGVSFSPEAKYAHTYANTNIGTRRAMIWTKVLVGNSIGGCYNTIIPPLHFDTTTGNSEKVFVKYNDYEFYPLYVVYYTS